MDGPVPDVDSQAPLRGHPHPAPPGAPGPGNPHSGRLHAFIYWRRWEEMRFSNGLGRRKALLALWEQKATAPFLPPPVLLSERNDLLETHRERLMAG